MRHLTLHELPTPPSGRRVYSDDTVEVLIELQGTIAGKLVVVCKHPTPEGLDAALEGRLRTIAERARTSLDAAGLQLGPQRASLAALPDGRRALVMEPTRTSSGLHRVAIDSEPPPVLRTAS